MNEDKNQQHPNQQRPSPPPTQTRELRNDGSKAPAKVATQSQQEKRPSTPKESGTPTISKKND